MNILVSTATTRSGALMRAALLAAAVGVVTSASPAGAMAPDEGHAGSKPSSRSALSSDSLLRIEISPTINDASLLHAWILARSLDATKAIVPRLEGREQWIAVEIAGATYDYRVSAVAMRDGEPVGSASEPVACVCNSDELLTLVDSRISAEAEELRYTPIGDLAAVIPPPPRPAHPVAVAPSPSLEDEPKRIESNRDGHRSLSAMGYSGIGLGVVGAGTLGAGVALIVRPDQVRGPAGTARRLSTHAPGIAMTVGGGIALASSVVLIAVDLTRDRDRAISLSPTFSTHQVGLSLTRRF